MKSEFLETAFRIGARTCRDAIWSGDRCNWIGAYADTEIGIVYRALGADLYSGVSGIALFLLQLYRATGDSVFRLTAEGAIRQAIAKYDASRFPGCGLYTGCAGLSYVTGVAATTMGDELYLQTAVRIATRLWVDGAKYDVARGSAGAILAILGLLRRTGRDSILDVAVRHRQALIDSAVRTNGGWSWKTGGSYGNLTGLGFGAAGIGAALLEMYRETGAGVDREGATEAFRYERSVFNTERGNWPDYRYPTVLGANGRFLNQYSTSWCHGAPGIGFSRLRALSILPDDKYEEEVRIAIRTSVQEVTGGSRQNYSFGHGLSGIIEFLLCSGEALGDGNAIEMAARSMESGIERYEGEGILWPCGISGDEGETPDLMLGTAGIGYTCLRLYDPVQFPTIGSMY